jgi:hypothetical protein
MPHIVTLAHNGNTFYLRSTIWTSERDRAQVFQSVEAAQAGLLKAKPFMKAAMFRRAAIVVTHFEDAPE